MNITETEALDAMHAVAPVDWWRFVPCGYCRAKRGEPCTRGGDGWPKPAGHPHAARVHDAGVIHACLWLLRHFPEDVTKEGDQ